MVEGSSPNDDCDSNPIGATHHSPQKEGRLEMYLTECLEKLEDFSWPNGVPTSNYGVVKRYLLSDPKLKKELLNTYGPKKSFVELSKRIHPLRQRESQIIKQCAEEVAKLGIRACVSDRDLVALLAGGAASREVYRAIRLQDPPTLAEAHKGAEENLVLWRSWNILFGLTDYGVVVRKLMSDPVRCELYLCAARFTSTGELLRGAKEGAVERIRPMEVICGANQANLRTVVAVGCFSGGCLDHHRRDSPQIRV
ncbi:hypothetical protein T02_3318 [Trichinella nativa]|uniref:Uncharacterized protein n=1 Tax=Trichinella nativa TaxID=6335 RepID=A0A0V1KNS0_9BILA|nr:hypothetical protein T02_3318 [Trichinella nativa]